MRLQSATLLLLSTSLAVASGGGLQSSWEQRQRGACDNVLPAGHPKVPYLLVPKCGSRAGHATAKPYVLANGNGSAAQATEARVCFTTDELCADPSLPPPLPAPSLSWRGPLTTAGALATGALRTPPPTTTPTAITCALPCSPSPSTPTTTALTPHAPAAAAVPADQVPRPGMAGRCAGVDALPRCPHRRPNRQLHRDRPRTQGVRTTSSHHSQVTLRFDSSASLDSGGRWAGRIHNPTGQSPGSGPNATTPIPCDGGAHHFPAPNTNPRSSGVCSEWLPVCSRDQVELRDHDRRLDRDAQRLMEHHRPPPP